VGADLSTEIKLKKWWKFTNESDVKLTRVEKPSPIDPTKTATVTEIEGLKENDVIIGSKVAEKLNKNPGDNLKINGSEFNIKGVIMETGSQDDSIIFMNLKTAQKLLGKEGKITLVEVAAICSGCPVEEMARQINEAVPEGKATPIKQVVAQKMQTINQLSSFGLAVGAIVLLIGSLIVFTTMMSSVNERTREIGIRKAVGAKKRSILTQFLFESSAICMIGGLIGVVLSFGVAAVIDKYVLPASVSIPIVLIALVISIMTGVVSGLIPAYRASRLNPIEALRYE